TRPHQYSRIVSRILLCVGLVGRVGVAAYTGIVHGLWSAEIAKTMTPPDAPDSPPYDPSALERDHPEIFRALVAAWVDLLRADYLARHPEYGRGDDRGKMPGRAA